MTTLLSIVCYILGLVTGYGIGRIGLTGIKDFFTNLFSFKKQKLEDTVGSLEKTKDKVLGDLKRVKEEVNEDLKGTLDEVIERVETDYEEKIETKFKEL